jgi:hypothetical protein
VQPLLSKPIPVHPRAAALLVVDADALGSAAPSDAEIARVLRRFGTAWITTRRPVDLAQGPVAGDDRRFDPLAR